MTHPIEVATTLLPEDAGSRIVDACQVSGFRCSHYLSEDELLRAIGNSPPDIVVMGLDAEASRPLSLQRNLWTAREPACVIFLAANPETSAVVSAMQFGATSVIPMQCEVDVCRDALNEAAQLHAARSKWMSDTRDARQRINQLSARQREVMKMTLDGRTNKALALRLSISEKTIEKHRDQIRQRTQTSTAPELERLKTVAERPLSAVYRLQLSEIQELMGRGDLHEPEDQLLFETKYGAAAQSAESAVDGP